MDFIVGMSGKNIICVITPEVQLTGARTHMHSKTFAFVILVRLIELS